MNFLTLKELADHQRGGHKSRIAKALPDSKPKGLSKTEQQLLAEGKPLPALRDTGKPAELPVPPVPPASQLQEPVVPEKIPPLELQYKWVGRHEACRTEPRTISIKVGGKNVIIAFCVSCNLELGQMEVIPLDKQKTNIEEGVRYKH